MLGGFSDCPPCVCVLAGQHRPPDLPYVKSRSAVHRIVNIMTDTQFSHADFPYSLTRVTFALRARLRGCRSWSWKTSFLWVAVLLAGGTIHWWNTKWDSPSHSTRHRLYIIDNSLAMMPCSWSQQYSWSLHGVYAWDLLALLYMWFDWLWCVFPFGFFFVDWVSQLSPWFIFNPDCKQSFLHVWDTQSIPNRTVAFLSFWNTWQLHQF